jgi:hypothetical protein
MARSIDAKPMAARKGLYSGRILECRWRRSGSRREVAIKVGLPAVRAATYLLFTSAFACGGNGNPADASTDQRTDARDAAAVDVEAGLGDGMCAEPDPSLCQCGAPAGSCCASIASLPPTCNLSPQMPACLPSCDIGSLSCNSKAGPLDAVRPMCNRALDCQQYQGYESCCNIACEPHRVSVCLSASEAKSHDLTCLP